MQFKSDKWIKVGDYLYSIKENASGNRQVIPDSRINNEKIRWISKENLPRGFWDELAKLKAERPWISEKPRNKQ
jgi:hypothetical protein